MMQEKDWTIEEIEALTEDQAQEMALEKLTIKEHNVYLVDFGGYFGYSALVFAENHHIHFANDYELHHPGKSKEELRAWYIEELSNVLFTEQEIAEPVRSHKEYEAKYRYLRDKYSQRRDYVSAFYIETGKSKEEIEARKQKIENMIYDPVSYCYMEPSEKDFIVHHIKLVSTLIAEKEKTLDNFDYWKDAFIYEMYNHEYGINWDADFDTLSAFGNLRPTKAKDELGNYFKQLGFTAKQKKAYLAARTEYLRQYRENA